MQLDVVTGAFSYSGAAIARDLQQQATRLARPDRTPPLLRPAR